MWAFTTITDIHVHNTYAVQQALMKGRYFKTPLALAAWSGPSGSSEKIDGKIKKITKYNHYYKIASFKSRSNLESQIFLDLHFPPPGPDSAAAAACPP